MTSDNLKARAKKGGEVAGAGGAGAEIRIERISLDGGGACSLGVFKRSCDEGGGGALFAAALTDVEAGDGPNGLGVWRFQGGDSIEVGHRGTRSDLTPADGDVVVKGKEAGWRTLFDDLVEGGFVGGGGIFSVGRADAEIHAPAALAGAGGAKEIDQGGE